MREGAVKICHRPAAKGAPMAQGRRRYSPHARPTRGLTVASAVCALWASSAGAASVSPADAAKHVGETATVCGVVTSAKFLADARSQPTLLNLDKPYPDQLLTIVIFGDDRAKFGTPETAFQGKRICVTGVIQIYQEKPEIILKNPSQLEK
jgi:hypothetical protein